MENGIIKGLRHLRGSRSGVMRYVNVEEGCDEEGIHLCVDNRRHVTVLLPFEEAKENTADACRNCLVAPSLYGVIMLCRGSQDTRLRRVKAQG